MQVSQAFYDVAGPILWRYPVIDFDRHALTLIDGIDVETTKKHRNTLLPLIKNIKPLTVRGEEALQSDELETIKEAFAGVEVLQVHLAGCGDICSFCRQTPFYYIPPSDDSSDWERRTLPRSGVCYPSKLATQVVSSLSPKEIVYDIVHPWTTTAKPPFKFTSSPPALVSFVLDLSDVNSRGLATDYMRLLVGKATKIQILLFDRHIVDAAQLFDLDAFVGFVSWLIGPAATYVIYILDDYRTMLTKGHPSKIHLELHQMTFDPNAEIAHRLAEPEMKASFEFRSRATYIEEYSRGQHHHFTPEEMTIMIKLEEEKTAGEPWYFAGDWNWFV